MGKSIALLVLVFAAVMILQGLTRAAKPTSRGLKPVARRFMTPRETAMIDILERCLPQYRFHAQGSMGALLNAAANPMRRRVPSDRNAFALAMVWIGLTT